MTRGTNGVVTGQTENEPPMTAQSTTQLTQNSLGRGGPIVSRFALGAMSFGFETNEAEAFRQLDLFVDHGGTFIDTADVYNDGVSEQIIGKWGQQRDGVDDLVIATKGRFAPPAGSHGASRRSLVRSVNASLKRLQMEAIDLYFEHGWDPYTNVADTLATLADLVQAGKIHNIAWSNVTGWQLQKIISTAEALGLPMPVAMQPQYNLLERGVEVEVLSCCLDAGIALTPWSPLGGDWLTGKYTAAERPIGKSRLGEDPNRGVEAYDLRNTDRTYKILGVLASVGTAMIGRWRMSSLRGSPHGQVSRRSCWVHARWISCKITLMLLILPLANPNLPN